MSTDERELIRDYAVHHSETAFTQLVQRNVNLVFSAARRQVQSHHQAEEVTQSVFVALAQNASKLKPETPLTPWLYLVTRRMAVDLMRRESRRQAREQTALEIAAMKMTPPLWEQIKPALDDAMAALDPSDSCALLLRFFENKSLREVGAALGVSEDAAQKRVNRALERLRLRFGRNGLAVTAAGLAADLSAHAVEVTPSALGLSISSVALTGASTTTIPATLIAMTTLQKSVLITALALTLGGALFEAKVFRGQGSELNRIRQQNEKLAAQAGATLEQNAAKALQLEAARKELDTLRSNRVQADPADLATGAEMEAWLQRVHRLKQLVEQMPGKAIPEMRLLSEDDWFNAAQYANLDDESWAGSGREITMKGLRGLAKGRFGMYLYEALHGYTNAHGGQLPSDVLELQPFFKDTPDLNASLIGPDMLQRYAVVYSGRVEEVPRDERNATLVEITSSDEEHDQRFSTGPGGWSMGKFTDLAPDTQHALRSFANDNAGAAPSSPSQLLPYFNPRLSPARQEKFIQNAASLLPR